MTDRDLLMIPGPIEFEPAVMAALGAKTTSHLDPRFMAAFGRALVASRKVALADDAQPFIVAGTGTLAMEMAIANVVEPGDRVLVVGTGYFSDRIGTMAERQGATVSYLRAAPGDVPALDEIERALASGSYKAVTVTHVDTSTGVLAPVEAIARLARVHGALSIVDGVCALGGEELRQDAWGVDIAFAGSQKALGAPPGLAVLTVSKRAMEAHRARKARVPSMYLDFSEWLPIMDAYEHGKPAYFATPAVNLVSALDVSLGQLLAEGMDARFARHRKLAGAFRAAEQAMGLRTLPVREDVTAHTLSALYYPDGVDASLVGRVRERGVVIAGGLHPDLKTRYFRIGHMGAVSASDVVTTVSAVARALVASGAKVDTRAAVAAAEGALS